MRFMYVSFASVPEPRLGADGPAEPAKPRALTAVEERDLAALHFAWDDQFDIGFAGGAFWAMRITTGALLTGATADELAAAILLDWSRR